MGEAKTKITISAQDLDSRKVERRLKEQAAMARNRANARLSAQSLAEPAAPAAARWGLGLRWRLSYHSAVYMSLFGLAGGLVAWATLTLVLRLEPAKGQMEGARDLLTAIQRIDDEVRDGRLEAEQGQRVVTQLRRAGSRNPYFQASTDPALGDAERRVVLRKIDDENSRKQLIANVAGFGVCGVMLALFLAVAEPATDRNVVGAVTNGSVGAVAGLVGGVAVSFLVERIFAALGGSPDVGAPLGGGRQVAARAITWGVLGLFLTLGPGLVMRNPKKLAIGALGGLLGGLLGGVLYDVVAQWSGKASFSDLVGLTAIGLVAGAGTGLIENATKSGWLRVIAGVIAGKQFILYRDPTYIGSGPDCQVYLFKDAKVGRRHAAIHRVNGGFEVENLPLGAATLVNGEPVTTRRRLVHGDRVEVGSTVFLFQERAGNVGFGMVFFSLMDHMAVGAKGGEDGDRGVAGRGG